VRDFRDRNGLISNCGQRKQAFYTLQKSYTELTAAPPDQ
jgi:hypothetical protein